MMQPSGPAAPQRAFWPRSPLDASAAGGPARAFYCQICRLSCSGPQPWRQHMESARHMKLEADLTRRPFGTAADVSSGSVNSGSVLALADSDSPGSPSRRPPGGKPFFCEICQLACTGPEPWTQHVQSAKHLKRAILEGRPTSDGGAGSQPPSRPGSALSVDDVLRSAGNPGAAAPPVPPARVGAGDNFYCDVCRLSCSGPEPWMQHVQSAKHMKKKAQAGGPGGGSGSTAPHASRPRSSSPSTDVADDLQSLSVMSDSALPGPPPCATGFAGVSRFCDVCRISSSGPEPWQQHIESAKHLKLASQAGRLPGYLGGTLASSEVQRRPSTEGTGSAMVVAGTGPPRSASSSPISVTGGSLVGGVCRISSSGPELWKQHTESANRIKMTSECGSLLTEPPNTDGEVSGSTRPMETEDPRQRLNPFNPFYTAAESDGVGLGGPSAAPVTDPAPGPGHDALSSASPQSWEWPLQLPEVSAVSDRPAAQADRVSPHLRRPAAADVTSVLGSPSASFSGRPTPVSVITSVGRFACDVCQLECTGPESLQQHLRGAKHMKMAARRQHAIPGFSLDSATSSPTRARAPAPTPTRPMALVRPVPAEVAMGTDCDLGHTDVSEACRSIRIGSWLHVLLDRRDGISEQDSLTSSYYLRQLHVEGLVAFLEDAPLIRCEQPFSLTRC